MPVHNSQRYVREAVESVLAQTFRDFELIALNDGGIDKSLSILREFESTDGRVRLISREHRGIVATRNELITLARGRYFAVLDSDDICRPQRLERQVAYLNENPNCVAVGARSLVIDSSGMPIMETKNELTHEEIDSCHLTLFESRICNSSVMMRGEAVLAVGKYREDYLVAEDLDLFLRLAEIGKLANLPDVLVEYRQHLNSACYTSPDRLRQFARQAVLEARTRRGIAGAPPSSDQNFIHQTPADVHRKWAWWALAAGNLKTARKHAITALATDPFNKESLRVAACALRGY